MKRFRVGKIRDGFVPPVKGTIELARWRPRRAARIRRGKVLGGICFGGAPRFSPYRRRMHAAILGYHYHHAFWMISGKPISGSMPGIGILQREQDAENGKITWAEYNEERQAAEKAISAASANPPRYKPSQADLDFAWQRVRETPDSIRAE